MQRALIQFAVPKNYQKVKKALIKAHREDLIGNGKDCLIGFAPKKLGYQGKNNKNASPRSSSKESKQNSGNHKKYDSKNNRRSDSSTKFSVSNNKNSKNGSRRSSNKKRRVN